MADVPQGEIINGAARIYTGNVPNVPKIGGPNASRNMEIAALQKKQQDTDAKLNQISNLVERLAAGMDALLQHEGMGVGKPARKGS